LRRKGTNISLYYVSPGRTTECVDEDSLIDDADEDNIRDVQRRQTKEENKNSRGV